MDTFELITELAKKPKEEIKYALVTMMESGKIDFLDVNQAYIQFMENIKEDRLNRLIEAESCVLESFIYRKTKKGKDEKSKGNYNHTQRCLYLMNKSGRYNTKSMNEDFVYDEEYAKTMSWYERNKQME